MNARLHEVAAEGREGDEARRGDENVILDDGRQQRGHCTDLRDYWIGKAGSGYAGVDERHIAARGNEIDFPPCELLKAPLSSPPAPPPSYGPAISFGNVDVLPDNIAAPSSSITSHAGDNTRSRARDIGTTSCSTMRFPPYAPAMSCNVACSNTPATACNVAPAGADCDGPEATWTFRDNDHHLPQPQAGTCAASTAAATSRTCQQGPVDVEDLAMYFDLPTDGCRPPPPTGNRAIYSRRSRYGQAARIDRDRDTLQAFRHLSPCDLAPNDLRACDMGPSTLGYCDLGYNDGPSLRDPAYDGSTRFCEPRLDESRFCGARQQPCEPGRHDLGRDDPESSNWFCNVCPELFNFCSEERWLQCPMSDRCPLYDTSYAYGAPVLPPCMYKDGYYDNDNEWHYGYVEDEQLLEDYL